MRTTETSRKLGAIALIALVTLIVNGCAVSGGPRHFLVQPEQEVSDTWGGWARLRLADGMKIEGELIAVSPDTLYVLQHDRREIPRPLTAVGVADLRNHELLMYRPENDKITGWGLLGTASTVSHGFFLLVSAPTWVITSAVTTHTVADLAKHTGRPMLWEPYARYPQGLPPELRGATFLPKY